jgi:2-polyprenyl-3-methyl-5-hydroxy-6-metoxy-1,4-benzoquinol methylase
MNITRLIGYTKKPALYENGSSIMWTDPYISQQLLNCHIDPTTDMASRSDVKIDLLINWIQSHTKAEHMNILDLGCGPGLYAEKLARKGHTVTGVDFSSNSIEYARQKTKENGSNITYYCKDYLNIDFKDQFDLVILIYLDFCVLKPHERKVVLDNIYRALKSDGLFVFDVVNSKNIEEKVLKPSWEVCKKGFWKDEPYIAFTTGYHYSESKVLLNQHIVITEDDKVDTYHFWSTYYEYEELRSILNESNFEKIQKYENVLPESNVWNGENVTFYVVEK